MIQTIKIKRKGLATSWNRVNPILENGEVGFEKDTKKIKIGDGIHAWKELPYLNDEYAVDIQQSTITLLKNAYGLYINEAVEIKPETKNLVASPSTIIKPDDE